MSVDEDELTDSIKDLLSKDAWEQIGNVKIKRKRKVSKPKQEAETTPAQPAEATPPKTEAIEPGSNSPA